ncbi:CLUMA_CG016683, isoform A [Clunio marinus]|uniref:CLUMA_CG016683, isoform A n=1 Tax=Clunio marinus TaxID=568069 RepID=A0A1J1IV03_9DIPT|nr:CLUMA_CG016683, isoform A [Clunio marinus]
MNNEKPFENCALNENISLRPQMKREGRCQTIAEKLFIPSCPDNELFCVTQFSIVNDHKPLFKKQLASLCKNELKRMKRREVERMEKKKARQAFRLIFP